MSKKDDTQGPQKEESKLENENPSILFDQSITVDGVIYREKRSLYSVVIQEGPDAGKVERVLVHTRSMGDKTYTVHKIGFGSDHEKIEEVLEENKMNSLELAAFQEVWNGRKERIATIREDEPGILTRFFKMMNPFA